MTPLEPTAASSNLFMQLVDIILHIDVHLQQLAVQYGLWVYGIVFLIIFCETGLVVLPLLPGDSLIFAAGSLASTSGAGINPHLLFLIIFAAAVLGDNVNYWVGRRIGAAAFQRDDARFLKRKYLDQTRAFYQKHGVKTIILARFVPIVRTFAPFVAGVGAMPYARFLSYDLVGGLAWVGIFVYSGYYFGRLPMVRHNFSLVILAIILVSLVPPLIEVLKHRRRKR